MEWLVVEVVGLETRRGGGGVVGLEMSRQYTIIPLLVIIKKEEISDRLI